MALSKSFLDMKKSRTDFTKLASDLQKAAGGKSFEKDARFWEPTKDKTGNGYARLRFLPAPEGESLPFVKYFSHGFQDVGGWYINPCPTAIGLNCPVCEKNNELRSTKVESNIEIAKGRKRRKQYVGNVYIIEDPTVPSNNGKVFLYKFGQKILDKLLALPQPKFPGQKPIDGFSLFEGPVFELKIFKNEGGYPDYSESAFEKGVSAIAETDDEINAIWQSQHKLAPFTEASYFEDYETLLGKFQRVTRTTVGGIKTTSLTGDTSKASAEPARKPSVAQPKPPVSDDEDDGEGSLDSVDDALAMFTRLAAESDDD